MAKEPDPRTGTRKVTVSLPISLVDRLDDKVPPRQRSAFIARAIERQLAIEEQATALEEAAGAWPDEDYPDLETEEAIDRWVAELRGPAYGQGADSKDVDRPGAEPPTSLEEKSDRP
jgi:hypothetical protein